MDQRRSHHRRIDRLSDIQPAGLYRLRRSGIAASAKAPEQFKVKLPVRPGKACRGSLPQAPEPAAGTCPPRTGSSAIWPDFFVYLPMTWLGRAYIADMGHSGKVAFDSFDMMPTWIRSLV